MSVWTVLLNIYLVQLIISIPILILLPYFDSLKNGKRKAIIAGVQGFFWGLIPIVGMLFAGVTIYIIGGEYIKKWVKKWVENDPTSPSNMSNPNFTPPPKKVKKVEPINSRTEILDL